MIAQIRELNRTADEAFLTKFNEPALVAYLGRLNRLTGQRGPQSVWVRREPRFPMAAQRSATRAAA